MNFLELYNFQPALLSAIIAASALCGSLIMWLFRYYKGRVGALHYSINHDRVALSNNDETFGHIEVFWNTAKVDNLFISTIRIVNETPLDLCNLKVKVSSPRTTNILNETSMIDGAFYQLEYSDRFQKRLDLVPPNDKPTPAQSFFFYHNREYIVEVLNRDSVFTINLLTTFPTATVDQLPNINVAVFHPGIKLKYVPTGSMVWGVPTRITVPLGLCISLSLLLMLCLIFPYYWALILACGTIGLLAQGLAAVLYKVSKAFRRIALT